MFKALSIALHKDSSFEVISEFCNFLDKNGNSVLIFIGYEVEHSLKVAFDFDM